MSAASTAAWESYCRTMRRTADARDALELARLDEQQARARYLAVAEVAA